MVTLSSITEWWQKLNDSLISHARGRAGEWWLAVVAFAESSFFPLPPDVLIMAMVLSGVERIVRTVTIATTASAFGGVLGYLIGWSLFDLIGEPLVNFYHLQVQLAHIGELFTGNVFLAIFTAAFTPIPYKVFTIAAGLFKVDLLTFLVASIIGRGLRFAAVAYLTKTFGKRLAPVVYRYFNWLTLVVVLLVIGITFYFL